jgi:adenine-specific DNA-methyltransferase
MNRDRISVQDAKKDIEQKYWNNYDRLNRRYKPALDSEMRLIKLPISRFRQYKNFCDSFKEVNNSSHFSHRLGSDGVKSSQANSLYDLFTTYFSNSYFGLKQCLQIDSLKFAIDRLDPQHQRRKYLYLCALIYSLDSCVASPGHFAQFLTAHSRKSFSRIVEERKKDIRETFYDIVSYFCQNLPCSSLQHEAWCTDYVDLFDPYSEFHSRMKEVDLVYADPPYTADHYSRFYHVLETLVKYDYPEIDGKGLYRKDRFASNFSIKSKSISEFDRLLSLVSSHSYKLLLSYNNDGLISSDQLIKLCKMYFARVEHSDTEYNHSNQGRINADCQKRRYPRKEYLLYCTN